MDTTLHLPCDVENVSDGYHTFAELYAHRNALWALLLSKFSGTAFKTLKDHEGKTMDGWFIGGINSPVGQITYHLPLSMWNMVNVKEVPSNCDYDGHTSYDVQLRLLGLLRT